MNLLIALIVVAIVVLILLRRSRPAAEHKRGRIRREPRVDELKKWQSDEVRDVKRPRDPRTKYCFQNMGTEIKILYYGKPRIISYAPATCFYPVPEVDSAILRLDPYSQPAVAVTESEFFDLVRAGFSASRKQLANSLAQGLGLAKTEILPLLWGAGISPQRRAATLTLDDWARLWQEFSRGRNADITSAS